MSANLAALHRKGSFTRNLAITFSGSATVTALGLLLTPVMSRVYSPESYGQYAIYSSIVSNIDMFSKLAYPWALLLPKSRKRFFALVQLSILLTLVMLVLLSLAIAVTGKQVQKWLHAEALTPWIFIIPFIVMVCSLNSIMSLWLLRNKEFAKRAGIDVGTALVGRGITVGYGWHFYGSVNGLIIGDVFSKIASFVGLLRGGIYTELSELYRTFSWRRIKSVAIEYRDYPIYSLPTGYLGVIAVQLPIFMLTASFGATMVGLYSFSTSLLEIPISLIGNSLAPVFQQKATETYHQTPERLGVLCLQLYNKLFYVGLLPFGIITVYGDLIFSYAFGARWEMAGLFTSFLGYYYVFRLASVATAPVLALLRRQELGLIYTLLLLGVRAAGLSIGIYLQDVRLATMLFGIGSLLVTFIIDMYTLTLMNISINQIVVRSSLLISITLIMLKLSRNWVSYFLH